MWNDTVRKQSESSFITGDINSSASLNRGNYKLFFLSLTLVMAVMSLKYIAPFFPSPPYLRWHQTLFTHTRNVALLSGRRFCGGCFVFSFLSLFLHTHF